MTTLNISQTQSEENKKDIIVKRKLSGIDKFINRAQREYDIAVLKENYGIANTKYGFLEGLKAGRSHLTYCWFVSIDVSIEWAESKLMQCVNNKDYGKCDQWQSYISALNVCKAIIVSI